MIITSQNERSLILKKIMLILLCTLMMVPSFVSAHTSISTSNPSEGQVVTENLEQIILTFATSIVELSTMDLIKDGNVIPLEGIKVENKQLMGLSNSRFDLIDENQFFPTNYCFISPKPLRLFYGFRFP